MYAKYTASPVVRGFLVLHPNGGVSRLPLAVSRRPLMYAKYTASPVVRGFPVLHPNGGVSRLYP